MDRCQQRVQQQTCGHRGRAGDPLYGIRRVLRTGVELLTAKQRTRLDAVFADGQHAEVEITWNVYQAVLTAYRDPSAPTARQR